MPTTPDRIYPLDVLRGIAALSVVFWHWQHFFYQGAQPADFDATRQPLFEALSLFYRHGSLAVELFFSISGFVFFWLFSQRIAARGLTASRFFMDRFSRLYPLHALTFLLVMGLQWAYLQHHPDYFVYQANDAWHALLNLLLIPAWGLETGWSFNAPIWSVSVECLLYVLFFLICLAGRWRYWLMPGLLLAGFVLYPLNYKLGSGVFTFFAGGIAFVVMHHLLEKTGVRSVCGLTLLLSLVAWTVVATLPTNPYFIMGIAFPLSVMFIASLSWLWPALMKPWAVIGDLSYSSYLLHFPLQIIFALTVDALGHSRDLFYSPWMLLLFMSVLVPLSLASHRWFEVPVQRALRTRSSIL